MLTVTSLGVSNKIIFLYIIMGSRMPLCGGTPSLARRLTARTALRQHLSGGERVTAAARSRAFMFGEQTAVMKVADVLEERLNRQT